MFGYARDHQPCIIFMDEIDAIGGRCFSEGTSADREIQRTLMELLNQLDGFDQLGKGFNGTGLRNVCTEAGMSAIRAECDYIIYKDFMKEKTFPLQKSSKIHIAVVVNGMIMFIWLPQWLFIS